MKLFVKTLKWPDPEKIIPSEDVYPNRDWTHECQGVANDNHYWYFTQDRALWTISGSSRWFSEIPEELRSLGFNHMGDLDYYGGRLYVPLEGAVPPRILIYRTEAVGAPVYLSNAKLTHFDNDGNIVDNKYNASWCAINPLNGLLYTSLFDTDILYVYNVKISASEELLLEPLGNFKLFDENGNPLVVSKIQGGVISPNTGHLYLVSDIKDGGIMGFDMITGRRAFHKVVDYDPDETPPEELEGIDIWDQPSGQIHLVMLDNDVHTDDVYFKHYKVEVGSEEFV